MPASALGGGPGEMVRKLWPPSTEPNQTLRCVPVPVGPLTKTRPCGSTPISGSPNVWIGSAIDGVSKAMPPVAAAALGAVDKGALWTCRRTLAQLSATSATATREGLGIAITFRPTACSRAPNR